MNTNQLRPLVSKLVSEALNKRRLTEGVDEDLVKMREQLTKMEAINFKSRIDGFKKTISAIEKFKAGIEKEQASNPKLKYKTKLVEAKPADFLRADWYWKYSFTFSGVDVDQVEEMYGKHLSNKMIPAEVDGLTVEFILGDW